MTQERLLVILWAKSLQVGCINLTETHSIPISLSVVHEEHGRQAQNWLPIGIFASWASGASVEAAVAEVEPAVVVPEAPPNVGVEAVAPENEEKPKLAPAEGRVKPPTAGVGLGSAAGAACEASPLPAQQQLW